MAAFAQSANWCMPGILCTMDGNTQEVSDTQSDIALVRAALVDANAFAPIVGKYEQALNRYLIRLGVFTTEDREDLLQDIFIKVYKNMAGFDQSMKFSSWIYRIAHNETMSWYRKVRVRPQGHTIGDSDEVLEGLSDSALEAGELFDKKISQKVLQRALADLPEPYRSVLILRFFEHKEYEEISDILKMPIGTVGTVVSRGKDKLRSRIDIEMIHL